MVSNSIYNHIFDALPTPCYVVDVDRIKKNLEILKRVEDESGCRILLAQKAFSTFALYPLIGSYVSGTTASGLYEARLGYEKMGKENHVYAPAYKKEHINELVKICDHISFNSWNQFKAHKETIKGAVKVSAGIRINPRCSTQKDHAIYDPCASGSRLGVTRDSFPKDLDLIKEGIEGLHFHTLCEQNFDDLDKTFKAVEEQFAEELKQVKWLNMGGGHHITRACYDVEGLIKLVRYIREKYDVEVYLEPGEAFALDAGYLITEILDIVNNDMDILILDASAACHMPDVLEMPYRPPLRGSGEADEKAFTYRLSSLTCLAGDIIGDYSFDERLEIGDRLIFEDMAIYSMVKNNTFNGIPLPAIALLEDGKTKVIKEFGYDDFKNRLS